MKPTLLCLLLLAVSTGCTSRIDREAVVARHRIVTHATDPHSPAQVGNGGFAFGMDITGLQTFVPFNTLSDWGWHSFPQDETTRRQHYQGVPVEVGGRSVPIGWQRIRTGSTSDDWDSGCSRPTETPLRSATCAMSPRKPTSGPES